MEKFDAISTIIHEASHQCASTADHGYWRFGSYRDADNKIVTLTTMEKIYNADTIAELAVDLSQPNITGNF